MLCHEDQVVTMMVRVGGQDYVCTFNALNCFRGHTECQIFIVDLFIHIDTVASFSIILWYFRVDLNCF